MTLLPSLSSSNLVAGAKQPAVDQSYVSALTAADRFLQAWQSGEVEKGTALLISHARQRVTADLLDKFFSASAPSACEIGHGKLLNGGRYEFSGCADHRRFETRKEGESDFRAL
jgi:hypothetical protein